MSKIKTELVTFAKAELTASIASVGDFGLAFILSVFGDSHRRKRSVAWRYFVIWGISWFLNSGGTIALTEIINHSEHINIHYMIPKCVVAFLVAVLVNYPGQRKFVFKPQQP